MIFISFYIFFPKKTVRLLFFCHIQCMRRYFSISMMMIKVPYCSCGEDPWWWWWWWWRRWWCWSWWRRRWWWSWWSKSLIAQLWREIEIPFASHCFLGWKTSNGTGSESLKASYLPLKLLNEWCQFLFKICTKIISFDFDCVGLQILLPNLDNFVGLIKRLWTNSLSWGI